MTTKVRRDSLGTLAAPKEARVFEGRVARVHMPGDALKYAGGDEHRDIAELRKMVEKMAGKPVILLHPKNKKNLKRGGIAKIAGSITKAWLDGDHAIAQFVVHDDRALAAIESGAARELSLGYDVGHLDENRFQHDVDVDHLAIVPAARCGPTCELRYDSSDSEPCACSPEGNEDEDECDALTATERHELPASDFAVPATQGLPIEDAGHVRDAMARFGQEHFPSSAAKKAAYHHILSRAHALGIDAKHFEEEHQGHLDCACQAQACKCRAIGHGAREHGHRDQELQMTLDEITKKYTDALADAANANARATQAEKDRDAQTARADQAEKDRDQAQGRADGLENAVKTADSRVADAEAKAAAAAAKAHQDADDAYLARVNARAEILATAKPLIGKDDKGQPVDLAPMSDRAIKCAVISRLDGKDIPKEKSDGYVDAIYEITLEQHERASASRGAVRAGIEKPRQDAVTARKRGADAETAAREAMNSRTADAWTGAGSTDSDDE